MKLNLKNTALDSARQQLINNLQPTLDLLYGILENKNINLTKAQEARVRKDLKLARSILASCHQLGKDLALANTSVSTESGVAKTNSANTNIANLNITSRKKPSESYSADLAQTEQPVTFERSRLELFSLQYQFLRLLNRVFSLVARQPNFNSHFTFSKEQYAEFGLNPANLALLSESSLEQLLVNFQTEAEGSRNSVCGANKVAPKVKACSCTYRNTLTITPELKLNLKFFKEYFLPEWLTEDQFQILSKQPLLKKELGLADSYAKFLKKNSSLKAKQRKNFSSDHSQAKASAELDNQGSLYPAQAGLDFFGSSNSELDLNQINLCLLLDPKKLSQQPLELITPNTLKLSAQQFIAWQQLELVISLCLLAAQFLSFAEAVELDLSQFKLKTFLEEKFEFKELQDALSNNQQLNSSANPSYLSKLAELMDSGFLLSGDPLLLAAGYKEVFHFIHGSKHLDFFKRKHNSLLQRDSIAPEANPQGLAQYTELGQFALKLSNLLLGSELERVCDYIARSEQYNANEQDLIQRSFSTRLVVYRSYFQPELEMAQHYLLVALDSLVEYRLGLFVSEANLSLSQRTKDLLKAQANLSIPARLPELNQVLEARMEASNYSLLEQLEQSLALLSLVSSKDFSWELWFAQLWQSNAYCFNSLVAEAVWFAKQDAYFSASALAPETESESCSPALKPKQSNLLKTALGAGKSELLASWFDKGIKTRNLQLLRQLEINYRSAVVIASNLLAGMRKDYCSTLPDSHGLLQLDPLHLVELENKKRQQASLAYWQRLHLCLARTDRLLDDSFADSPRETELSPKAENNTVFVDKINFNQAESAPYQEQHLVADFEGKSPTHFTEGDLQAFCSVQEQQLQLQLADGFPYYGVVKQASWLEFIGVVNLLKYQRYILAVQELLDTYISKPVEREQSLVQEFIADLNRLYQKSQLEIKAVKDHSFTLIELLQRFMIKLGEVYPDHEIWGVCVNEVLKPNSALFRKAVRLLQDECSEAEQKQIGKVSDFESLLRHSLQLVIKDWLAVSGEVTDPNAESYADLRCKHPSCSQHQELDFAAIKDHLDRLKPELLRTYFPSFALDTRLQDLFLRLEASRKELDSATSSVRVKLTQTSELISSLLPQSWEWIQASFAFKASSESKYFHLSKKDLALDLKPGSNSGFKISLKANLNRDEDLLATELLATQRELKLNLSASEQVRKRLFIAQQLDLYRERQDYYLEATREVKLRNKSFKEELSELKTFDLFLLSCVLPYCLFEQGNNLIKNPETKFINLGEIRVKQLLANPSLQNEIRIVIHSLLSSFSEQRLADLLSELSRLTAQPLIKKILSQYQRINQIKPLPVASQSSASRKAQPKSRRLTPPIFFALEGNDKADLIETLDQLLKLVYANQDLLLARPQLFQVRELPQPDLIEGFDLNFALGQSLNQILTALQAEQTEVSSAFLIQIFIKDLELVEQGIHQVWNKLIARAKKPSNAAWAMLADHLEQILQSLSISSLIYHEVNEAELPPEHAVAEVSKEQQDRDAGAVQEVSKMQDSTRSQESISSIALLEQQAGRIPQVRGEDLVVLLNSDQFLQTIAHLEETACLESVNDFMAQRADLYLNCVHYNFKQGSVAPPEQLVLLEDRPRLLSLRSNQIERPSAVSIIDSLSLAQARLQLTQQSAGESEKSHSHLTKEAESKSRASSGGEFANHESNLDFILCSPVSWLNRDYLLSKRQFSDFLAHSQETRKLFYKRIKRSRKSAEDLGLYQVWLLQEETCLLAGLFGKPLAQFTEPRLSQEYQRVFSRLLDTESMLQAYVGMGHKPIWSLACIRYTKTLPLDLSKTAVNRGYLALVTTAPQRFYQLSQGNGLLMKLDWQAVTYNLLQHYTWLKQVSKELVDDSQLVQASQLPDLNKPCSHNLADFEQVQVALEQVYLANLHQLAVAATKRRYNRKTSVNPCLQLGFSENFVLNSALVLNKAEKKSQLATEDKAESD